MAQSPDISLNGECIRASAERRPLSSCRQPACPATGARPARFTCDPPARMPGQPGGGATKKFDQVGPSVASACPEHLTCQPAAGQVQSSGPRPRRRPGTTGRRGAGFGPGKRRSRERKLPPSRYHPGRSVLARPASPARIADRATAPPCGPTPARRPPSEPIAPRWVPGYRPPLFVARLSRGTEVRRSVSRNL